MKKNIMINKKSKKKQAKKGQSLSKQQQRKVNKKEGVLSKDQWIKKMGKQTKTEFNNPLKQPPYPPLIRGKNKGEEICSDLEPDSGLPVERCAETAMTLAHHGSPEAIKALKKFKTDPRAPDWIDCAIEECELIHWQDTIGKQINLAEDKLREAAEKIFNEHLVWDKEIITNALKVHLKDKKVKFTYGEKAKLYSDKTVIAEESLEFVIDDVFLAGIKPSLSDWIMRFKQDLEGHDMAKGDLENIEQSNFSEFYENYFQAMLDISGKPAGILLDFSGDKLHGFYFDPSKGNNGWHSTHCSGCCENCFEETKCETAIELKEEEDKRKYRILKKMIQEIVEIENKIEESKRPSLDLEYEISIAQKLRDEVEQKIKQEKNKEKIKNLKDELSNWECEIAALYNILEFSQPKAEEEERLETIKEMYKKIKGEIELDEYKNDVEGLEIFYGKAEPKDKDQPNFYHDPLCECDKYEPLSAEEDLYKYNRGEKEIENFPF